MATEDAPLTDEERAELEALRAEKARREEAAKAKAEREELARLKAAQQRSQAELAEDRRIAEARARGEKLMQPGDDLSMPLGQKLVLAGIAIVVIVFLLMNKFGG